VYVVGHQTPRLEPHSLSIRVLAHQRQVQLSIPIMVEDGD